VFSADASSSKVTPRAVSTLLITLLCNCPNHCVQALASVCLQAFLTSGPQARDCTASCSDSTCPGRKQYSTFATTDTTRSPFACWQRCARRTGGFALCSDLTSTCTIVTLPQLHPADASYVIRGAGVPGPAGCMSADTAVVIDVCRSCGLGTTSMRPPQHTTSCACYMRRASCTQCSARTSMGWSRLQGCPQRSWSTHTAPLTASHAPHLHLL
jgi:hypothetical protein